MCLIKDKDGILLEFEGATVAAVKRDICTRHPYTPDHISLYTLTEHGMCVDAMADDAAVESLDVFYMQVIPTLTRAEHEAFASTPTSLPDVTRTLQAYNEQLLEPVHQEVVSEVVPLVPSAATESPVSGPQRKGGAGAVAADSFCFI